MFDDDGEDREPAAPIWFMRVYCPEAHAAVAAVDEDGLVLAPDECPTCEDLRVERRDTASLFTRWRFFLRLREQRRVDREFDKIARHLSDLQDVTGENE